MSRSAYTVEWQHQRHLENRCINCGKPAVDTWRCARHLAANRLLVRRTLAARRLEGLCVDCGTKAVKGFSRCLACLMRRRLYQRRRRAGR
jgi:hypothetical protein